VRHNQLVWSEINLTNLNHNLQVIRQRIGPKRKIIGVVKADAYGHGAVAVAKSILGQGVDQLAVASVAEAQELGQAGVKAPILILGAASREEILPVVEAGFTPMVYTDSFCRDLASTCQEKQKVLKVHVRVEINSGNLGVSLKNCLRFVQRLKQYPWLEIEGLFTHLASSYGHNREAIAKDLARFDALLRRLKEHGITIPLIHAASSPAILRLPEAHYDAVRPGTSMYGLPSFLNQLEPLKPVMQFKTRIAETKIISSGELWGYGYQVNTNGPIQLAVIPVGYSNAFFMLFLKRGEVLINSSRAPIVGKAFMSHTLIDITQLPEKPLVGDEVVIFGRQGQEAILVQDIAEKIDIGTTHCESICFLNKSVERKYIS